MIWMADLYRGHYMFSQKKNLRTSFVKWRAWKCLLLGEKNLEVQILKHPKADSLLVIVLRCQDLYFLNFVTCKYQHYFLPILEKFQRLMKTCDVWALYYFCCPKLGTPQPAISQSSTTSRKFNQAWKSVLKTAIFRSFMFIVAYHQLWIGFHQIICWC